MNLSSPVVDSSDQVACWGEGPEESLPTFFPASLSSPYTHLPSNRRTSRMSRPHASSVDADNAWGKPVTPIEQPGQEDASDVVEKDKLVKYVLSLSVSPWSSPLDLHIQGNHLETGWSERSVNFPFLPPLTSARPFTLSLCLSRVILISARSTALLQRVTEVQGEGNKLKSDNETLQTCSFEPPTIFSFSSYGLRWTDCLRNLDCL